MCSLKPVARQGQAGRKSVAERQQADLCLSGFSLSDPKMATRQPRWSTHPHTMHSVLVQERPLTAVTEVFRIGIWERGKWQFPYGLEYQEVVRVSGGGHVGLTGFLSRLSPCEASSRPTVLQSRLFCDHAHLGRYKLFLLRNQSGTDSRPLASVHPGPCFPLLLTGSLFRCT